MQKSLENHIQEDLNKNDITMNIDYTITKTNEGFIAECTDLNIVTQGDTLPELLANLQEAIEFHLSSMEELKVAM